MEQKNGKKKEVRGGKKTVPVTPFRTAILRRILGLMLSETKEFAQTSQMNVSGRKEKDDRLQLVNKVEMSLIWEKALREDIATVTMRRIKIKLKNNTVISELKTQDSHIDCMWAEFIILSVVKRTMMSKVSICNVFSKTISRKVIQKYPKHCSNYLTCKIFFVHSHKTFYDNPYILILMSININASLKGLKTSPKSGQKQGV